MCFNKINLYKCNTLNICFFKQLLNANFNKTNRENKIFFTDKSSRILCNFTTKKYICYAAFKYIKNTVINLFKSV